MREEDESAELDHIANHVRVAHIGLPAVVPTTATQRNASNFRKRPRHDGMQMIANVSQLRLIARFSRGVPDTRRVEFRPEAVDAFIADARLRFQVPVR